MTWFRTSLSLCRHAVWLLSVYAIPALAEDRASHLVAFANHAGDTLSQIFIGPAGREDWGDNRLVGRVPPGFDAAIRYSGPCLVHIRVVTIGGRLRERDGVSLCESASFAVTDTSLVAVVGGVTTDDGHAIRIAAAARPRLPSAPASPPAANEPLWNGRFLTHHYGGLSPVAAAAR